jgi:thiamine biosynthesis protein ThiS
LPPWKQVVLYLHAEIDSRPLHLCSQRAAKALERKKSMITLNGRSVDDVDGLNLAELLARENHEISMIAVARNKEVVPRAKFNSVRLADGDVIDIVRMMAGG